MTTTNLLFFVCSTPPDAWLARTPPNSEATDRNLEVRPQRFELPRAGTMSQVPSILSEVCAEVNDPCSSVSSGAFELIENDRNMQFRVTKDPNAEAENARRYAATPHPISRYSTRRADTTQSMISISSSEESTSLELPNRLITAASAAAHALQNWVDRPRKVATAAAAAEQTAVKEVADNKKSTEPVKVLPVLPPRVSMSLTPMASTSSGGNVLTLAKTTPPTVTNEPPRPKPRISKMASATIDTNSQPPPSITSAAAGPNNFLTSSASRSSSCMRLAPIPVPEKSAAISHTIQHFANLTRQNVLRRSMGNNATAELSQAGKQQQQQAAASAKPATPKIPCKVLATAEKPKPNQYDQVSNQNQPVVPTTATGNGVGNPLYEKLPDIVADKSAAEAEAFHMVVKPAVVKAKPKEGKSSDLHEMSAASSNESLAGVSSPPPKQPPPQPPKSAVVRDFILKANIMQAPSPPSTPPGPKDEEEEEEEVFERLVTTASAFSRVQSPKMASRKKTTPRHSEHSNDNGKHDLLDRQLELIDFLIKVNLFAGFDSASPSVSPNPVRSFASVAPVPPPKPGTVSLAPPTLMPRRASAAGVALVAPGPPPPLPLVGPPSSSNSSSRQPVLPVKPARSVAIAQQTPTPRSVTHAAGGPPPPRDHLSPSPSFEAVQEKAANFIYKNNKLLNRSYSDAYTKQPNSRADRERKSLESGSASVSGDVAGHLSTSNRSLPTMGVAMLGKKKISNVSADSQAIEHALAQFERQTRKSEGSAPSEHDPSEPEYLEPQD